MILKIPSLRGRPIWAIILTIGKLLEYDIKHQTHLVENLHLYFNYGGSIQDAAKAAALTQSGFKYRFKKICEVSGFNLKDPDKRFDLQMALKIWCITRGSENLPNS
ncbi:helix-turn-helix domain-containing protein [Desulfoscipio gibsoniae]|uniref:PucR family transcriptional regulator n=1 Tax=Desulfoscipio gibsoniae TaxID=102134 RepID=UPI000232C058|nr:helix-turn-helix domain-containing protein [Desulfoscipio gibsoniae]